MKDGDLTQEVPNSRREYDEDQNKENSVVLKVSQNNSSEDEEKMTYLTKTFQKNMYGVKRRHTPTEQQMQTTSVIRWES